MSSSCQKLADRYVAETGKTIPAANAPLQERSDWFLTQQWGCILPGETVADFHPRTSSDPATDFCLKNNNAEKSTVGTSNALVRPPVYNYLKEDGFLDWVNQRGMKCINKIVGNFYGLNTATGNVNAPGPSITPPDSQCWGACFEVTSTSEMCFECVNQTLTQNPSLCPAIDISKPDDQELVRDAVNCHECIGTQGITNSVGATNETVIDNMTKCLNGTIHPPLSTADIVSIVIGAIFIMVIIIVLAVYYGLIHPKILKQEQERIKVMAAGYSPDEL
jgi:hypothetical protein